ncbi:MAG: hypothetical protein V1851_00305 [Patescibacteria group bacterium]
MITNHTEEKKEEISLMKRLRQFYFAPRWESLLSISYLFLFLYFAIFYIDKILIAIQFIFRTFTVPTAFLTLSHALWGAILVVALVMPFVISLAMITTLPNIWQHKPWKKDQKVLITILALFIAIFLIAIADDLITAVAQRDILDVFLNAGTIIRI